MKRLVLLGKMEDVRAWATPLADVSIQNLFIGFVSLKPSCSSLLRALASYYSILIPVAKFFGADRGGRAVRPAEKKSPAEAGPRWKEV